MYANEEPDLYSSDADAPRPSYEVDDQIPQQNCASPPLPQPKPLPAAKSHSIFTPIDDSRSVLAPSWGSFSSAELLRSDPKVKVEEGPQSELPTASMNSQGVLPHQPLELEERTPQEQQEIHPADDQGKHEAQEAQNDPIPDTIEDQGEHAPTIAPTMTDEGYQSMDKQDSLDKGDVEAVSDADSVRTDNRDSGLPPNVKEQLSTYFAQEILDNLELTGDELAGAIDDICNPLPDLLREFSALVARQAKPGIEERACIFVRHQRK